MSILATTDTAVVPQRARPRLRVVPAAGPVTVAWLDDLVVEHGEWLRRLVRRRMANPALVDDVVQETLLRVCRSSPPVDARDLRRWLAGVARHTCADVWRSQDPLAAGLDRIGETLPSTAATVPGSDDHVAAVVSRARINDALLRLPPRHRRLLEKQALLGLTYEEIADEEDVSIACVTSALGRARAGFRRRYADGEARSAPAWVAVVYRMAERLRARMARTQAALAGRAIELAAASFTLGMAGALVAVPAVSSPGQTVRAVDTAPASQTAAVAARATASRPPPAITPARTSRAAAPARSPSEPPRRAVGEVAADAPHVELTPEQWTVHFGVEAGGPGDTAHVRVGMTLHCEGGRVAAAVCPVAGAVPGAESSR